MNEIEARLATLEQHLGKLLADNEHLRADNADLRAQLAGLRLAPMSPADHQPPVVADLPDDDTTHTERSATDGTRPVSRRGMIAAVAGAAGGVLLTQATPAAATQGQAVLAGVSNTATGATIIITPSTALKGISTTGTTGYGVYGQSDGTSGFGVYGYAGAATGATKGVVGEATSPYGVGVEGRATATAMGGATGVRGTVNSPRGTGVMGQANTGQTGWPVWGVRGETDSPDGAGVYGWATSPTGTANGVQGKAEGSGAGVYGEISGTGPGAAVRGSCFSPAGVAVFGHHNGGGFAFHGNGRMKVTGRSYLGAPSSAPLDSDLDAGSVSMYLNETTDKLKVRVKYSNGTVKTATIGLL